MSTCKECLVKEQLLKEAKAGAHEIWNKFEKERDDATKLEAHLAGMHALWPQTPEPIKSSVENVLKSRGRAVLK